MSATIEEESRRWQSLIALQDDFVASLLESKQRLLELQGGEKPARLVASLQAQVAQLQAELALASTADNLSRPLAAQAQAARALESNGSLDAGPEIVLVNGTCAFFSDHLLSQGKTGGIQAGKQIRWEVSQDLGRVKGDFPIQVTVFCFIDGPTLVTNLVRNQLCGAATFLEFVGGFNRSAGCFLVDIGKYAPVLKIASVISLLGNNCPHLYIVGISPSELMEASPHLDPATGSALSTKLVWVNFREDPQDALWIESQGFRAASFSSALSTESMSPTYGWDAAPSAAEQDASVTGWSAPVAKREAKSGAKIKADPTKSLLQQTPQICVFHYVSPEGCNSGRDCVRSHGYDLSDKEISRLRRDVAKTPCKDKRKNGHCRWQETHGTPCMYNHAVAHRP